MNINTPSKYRLVIPGTIGEPEVLKALFGPQTIANKIHLEGFETRKQTHPPTEIWDILKQNWDEKGIPFLGTYTLVPQESKKTTVGCVEFDTLHELKKAAERLNFWDFHSSNRDEAWFRYIAFRKGDIEYVAEVLNPLTTDPSTLVPVEDNYRENDEYRAFVKLMAEQANEYRLSIEGSLQGKEIL